MKKLPQLLANHSPLFPFIISQVPFIIIETLFATSVPQVHKFYGWKVQKRKNSWGIWSILLLLEKINSQASNRLESMVSKDFIILLINFDSGFLTFKFNMTLSNSIYCFLYYHSDLKKLGHLRNSLVLLGVTPL